MSRTNPTPSEWRAPEGMVACEVVAKAGTYPMPEPTSESFVPWDEMRVSFVKRTRLSRSRLCRCADIDGNPMLAMMRGQRAFN